MRLSVISGEKCYTLTKKVEKMWKRKEEVLPPVANNQQSTPNIYKDVPWQTLLSFLFLLI